MQKVLGDSLFCKPLETLLRSIFTAKRSKKEEVSVEEIEENLVQLFLDFSA